jgi:S1-C subfamily serine protease
VFRDVSDEQASALKLHNNRGAEVVMVDHDGPANKAGVHPKDIIVSLNGQTVAGAEVLRRLIHDAGAGGQIALGVLRNGHNLTLTAQLADHDAMVRAALAHLAAGDPPSAPAANSAPEMPPGIGSSFLAGGTVDAAPPTAAATPPPAPAPTSHSLIGNMLHGGTGIGAMLETMEPQLAIYFGAPQGAGLLVHSVIPNSAAANAGLRAGDVVLRVDLYTMHSTADWTKRLHAAKGRALTLTVLRERRELTMTLQPDVKHHSLLEWPSIF